MDEPRKPRIATVSLAGCFGCHMSLLDLDERIAELLQRVELVRSPLVDAKAFDGDVDVGLIEGGVCNDDNVEMLRVFRRRCRVLVAVGQCAIMGGLPALRNDVPLSECLEEAYLHTPTTLGANARQVIPHHPDIPRLLDRVYPCHEVVKIDHFLPGCPPRPGLLWDAITALLDGRAPALDYQDFKYD